MKRKERSGLRSIDGIRKHKKTNRSISCESRESSKSDESRYSSNNKRNKYTLTKKKIMYINKMKQRTNLQKKDIIK